MFLCLLRLKCDCWLYRCPAVCYCLSAIAIGAAVCSTAGSILQSSLLTVNIDNETWEVNCCPRGDTGPGVTTDSVSYDTGQCAEAAPLAFTSASQGWPMWIRRREKLFLAPKGYETFCIMNKTNCLSCPVAQPTKAKTAVDWIHHFHYPSVT